MRIESLADVRSQLLGFTLKGAARLAGLSEARLRDLESGQPATVWELERLATLYGIDADVLGDSPIHVVPSHVVSALASSEEFHEVGDMLRSRIVAVARAARDASQLARLFGEEQASLFSSSCDTTDAIHRQGAIAAAHVRDHFGLGKQPISSLRDWLAEALPAITVLYGNLSASGPAALAFAGPSLDPTIVLNLDGKNRNACVRRFSLAHELCHLFVDWPHAEPLAQISGYASESGREREQRANAFAVRLICPESALDALTSDPLSAARELVTVWGLHYSAARLYLRNVRNDSLPPSSPPGLGWTGTEDTWQIAEAPQGLNAFPLQEVEAQRRTRVALLAAQAYSTGKIPRDEFAEYLGVSPASEIENVLDYFGLDRPEESASAA